MRFTDRTWLTPGAAWHVAPPTPDDVLARFPELSPLLVQLLTNRGLTDPQTVGSFLHPHWAQDLHDPFALRDMRRAVERLARALEKGQRMVIYGDYDADGVSAAAVLFQTLRALGAAPEVYLPDRQTEGYGLHTDAIERLAQAGAKVLVTVDCGTANVAEVARAAQLGIDVIITDHHAEPAERPQPFAFLNPTFREETYPFRHLSAGGVAFKLAQALLAHVDYGGALDRSRLPDGWEKWLLDYVTLSTVADMVPLLGENRMLVRYGLTVLQKSRHLGLRALARSARVDLSTATEDDIAFVFAPRINAAGRMRHASAAFRLLVTDDQTEADRLAEELTRTNVERQRCTAEVYELCLKQIGSPPTTGGVVFAGDSSWPAGLLGLVAGKLVHHYGVPAIVYGGLNGQTVASGRSVPGVDIMAALALTRGFLTKSGGHAQACGFTLADVQRRASFEVAFAGAVEQQQSRTKPPAMAGLAIDARLPIERADRSVVELIETLRPFGVGNKRPRFLAEGVEVVAIERVGGDQQHLKLTVAGGDRVVRKMIGFTFGRHGETLAVGERLDVVYELGVRTWNGNRELELKMIDARHSHER